MNVVGWGALGAGYADSGTEPEGESAHREKGIAYITRLYASFRNRRRVRRKPTVMYTCISEKADARKVSDLHAPISMTVCVL